MKKITLKTEAGHEYEMTAEDIKDYAKGVLEEHSESHQMCSPCDEFAPCDPRNMASLVLQLLGQVES